MVDLDEETTMVMVGALRVDPVDIVAERVERGDADLPSCDILVGLLVIIQGDPPDLLFLDRHHLS